MSGKYLIKILKDITNTVFKRKLKCDFSQWGSVYKANAAWKLVLESYHVKEKLSHREICKQSIHKKDRR